MKLLALDIDGVLNSRYYKSTNRTYTLDPERICILNEIILGTGCKILLTSTYRLHFADAIGVNMWFEAVGIRPEVVGITQRIYDARGNQIKNWLKTCKETIESLVILDDDNDMGDLMSYLILTNNDTGMTSQEASLVIERLNSKEYAYG